MGGSGGWRKGEGGLVSGIGLSSIVSETPLALAIAMRAQALCRVAVSSVLQVAKEEIVRVMRVFRAGPHLPPSSTTRGVKRLALAWAAEDQARSLIFWPSRAAAPGVWAAR